MLGKLMFFYRVDKAGCFPGVKKDALGEACEKRRP
jgi:hypothetical protein